MQDEAIDRILAALETFPSHLYRLYLFDKITLRTLLLSVNYKEDVNLNRYVGTI